MSGHSHPVNGLGLSFPRPGEALVTAYGNFDGADLTRLLGDARRVVERATGKRPDGGCLTFRDDALEILISGTPPTG